MFTINYLKYMVEYDEMKIFLNLFVLLAITLKMFVKFFNNFR